MAQATPLQLAQAAYAAYGDSTGGLNYQGRAMPDWDDLGDAIQVAWVAAAGAVERTLLTPPAEAGDG